jgi:lambda family phage tail tape measure protein
MSDTTVLEVKLDDLGTIEKADKKLKNFRGTFDSLDKQVSKGLGGGKGSSGWKKATMGTTEYDIARGSAGATGASGRDFANQARGLDGLVRLYATYAANVFAAGAAFRALSEAADTTNMIEGMNQLGAASGIALGTIAQNLRNATDGAISMREAMEATTKGTAAGLTGKQMTDLGLVANKASKALGIGMPDAISRLTRGISKLEPELLDELGLFTKIGPATENYARSIGKTTGSLTDFERRQAFANAVLKEGIDKFSSIEIPANPYDKLSASLKDLSFKALEIVNKALVPLVNLLSQNPVALLGVLGLIGASIVKSAIPALGQYRENLQKTADASRMLFGAMHRDMTQKYIDMAKVAGTNAEKAFKKLPATIDKVSALSKDATTFSKTAKTDYAALAGKDPFALTTAEIASLDRRASDLAKRNSEEAARLKAHVAQLKAIRAGAKDAGSIASEVLIKGTESGLTTPGSNDIINKRILNKLSSDTIRVTTAETQAIYGSRAAYTKLNEEIAKARAGTLVVQTGTNKDGSAITQQAPKITALQAGLTRTSGTIGIVAQKIGSLVSAFGAWGVAIGALIGAFALLDSWFTKTEKEVDAFNKAMQTTSDAVDNSKRTLIALARQPGIATASIQGFFALSNASNTTTDAIETQIDATKALLKGLQNSAWDRAIDNVKGLFNKDINSDSAKNLAETVQQQVQIFRAAGMGEQAEADFKKAIGVNSLDLVTVAERFKTSTSAQDEFKKSNKALAVDLAEGSADLQNFKTATENVTKAYDEFIQSTASSNPLFKVGAALEDLSVTMDKITNQSLVRMNAAFNDLASNPKKIAQFGPEFVAQFVTIRAQFKSTLEEYSAYSLQLANIDAEIAKRTEEKNNATGTQWYQMSWGMGIQGKGAKSAEEQRGEKTQQIQALQTAKKTIESVQLGIDTKVFGEAKDLFVKGVDASFAKGSKLIYDALGQATAKAAIIIAQAGIGALTGQRAAEASTRIKQDEIKIQMNLIQSNIELITSNTLLTATIEESNAVMALAKSQKDGDPTRVISAKESEVRAAGIFKQAMEKVSKGEIKTNNLNSMLTSDDPLANALLKQRFIKVQRETAAQEANRTTTAAQGVANTIEGRRTSVLGNLEDLNKERNLRNDILQQQQSGLDILASIDTLNSVQRTQEKIELENTVLKTKQLQEIAGYTAAINIAQDLGTEDGKKEAEFQRDLLEIVRKRQKVENDNKPISDRLRIKLAEFDVASKLNAFNEALLDQDLARLGIISSLVGFSTEQNVLATASLENKKQENKFALELRKITDEIAQLQQDTVRDNTQSIALKRTEYSLVTQRQEKEKDNKGLQDQLKLLEARFTLEQKLAGFAKTTADAQSQQAEDELNYRKELGLVTSFDAVKEKADLDRGRIARETAQGQSEIDKQIEQRSILEKRKQDIESDGIFVATEVRKEIDEMTRSITAQSTALEATNKQKLNAVDLNEKLGSKMTGFSKIVENSFQSMGDALADFAKTGKLDFKGLVDQMLLDLLRFEMRAQMSLLFKSVGGLQGMMNMLLGVGPITADPSRLVDLVGGSVMNNSLAKGGVYDAGLKMYAKGGMFTNSVVDQPTLFKFAKGTGLMGEAGPEAIMPLKRDSNGNLGVRSGGSGGNVDVVVNNYGNERATTKETTDSRGNRRIEVIVGDMVASEVARPGSSVQQSLAGSFNNKPALARR